MSARPAAHATEACTCGRLRRAARALTQLYDDAMEPSGLRVTQFSILRTLARDGPATMTTLAAALLLDRTALTRNLDGLVVRRLVQVTTGRDARTRHVAITPAGARAVRAATPCWREAQLAVAKRIGSDKLDALVTTLRELEALHPAQEP